MSVSALFPADASAARRALALAEASTAAPQGQSQTATKPASAGQAGDSDPTASATQVDLSTKATGSSGTSAAVLRLADSYDAGGLDAEGAGLLALQAQQQLTQSLQPLANSNSQLILNLFKP